VIRNVRVRLHFIANKGDDFFRTLNARPVH
jgi:hypothetical protein